MPERTHRPSHDDLMDRIAHAAGGALPEQPTSGATDVGREEWRSPEEGAEQLYALWREWNRKKIGLYRRAIARYHEEHPTPSRSPSRRDGEKGEGSGSREEGEKGKGSGSREGEKLIVRVSRDEQGVVRREGIVSPPPPEGERHLQVFPTPRTEGEREGVAEDTSTLGKIPDADRAALMASVDADPALTPVKARIASRFHDARVRQTFEDHLTRILAERERLAPSADAWRSECDRRDTAADQLDAIDRSIYAHREREPEESVLLDRVIAAKEIAESERRMHDMERADPDLVAAVTFERIRTYHDHARRGGFVWTPSREQLSRTASDHLVVLDRNRPVLLTGDTGTGKTAFARALARRLTGRDAFEVGEEAKADIRPLLGVREIDPEHGTFIRFGPLGQAITGKKTSRDTDAGPGGIFYLDEMNGYPPDALRSIIKQLSGRKAGDEVSFAAWGGHTERIASGFALLGSANLPSPKHPDRKTLVVEVSRETTAVEVPYLPADETHEILLAYLMDQNDRVRLPQADLDPWVPVLGTDAAGKEIVKEYRLAGDRGPDGVLRKPDEGGTLWRFAALIADLQSSYQGKPNVRTATDRDASYLKTAVLDVGLASAWVEEYRKSSLRQGRDLRSFLAEKLAAWAQQPTFPEKDRTLLTKFLTSFNFSPSTGGGARGGGAREGVHAPATILSPVDLGHCSPFVQKTPERVPPPSPQEAIAIIDGQPIRFRLQSVAGFPPDTRVVRTDDPNKRVWTIRGVTGDGAAIIRTPDGLDDRIASDMLGREFERAMESHAVTATVRADALCTIPAEQGQEITLDLREVLESSLAFLEDKAPPAWVASLREQFPHGIALTSEQRHTIETAIEHGFTRAILMPGADVQGITTIERTILDPTDPTKTVTERVPQDPDRLKEITDHVLNTCSNADGHHPVPGLPDEEQYTAPYVYEPEKTKVPTLRKGAPPRIRPYLVLVGPGPIPQSMKNLTFPQADAAFASLATTRHLPTLTGLTNPEAELLQRKEVEERASLTADQRTATYGDVRPHAFDAYSDTATESNWTWHLDSRVPGGSSRGDWYPGSRQRRLVWSGASLRHSRLGARPAVVVEL